MVVVAGVTFTLSSSVGAAVCYTDKRERGQLVRVEQDDEEGAEIASADVVERTVNGRKTYAAVFPHLAPGPYCFRLIGRKENRHTYVTVFPSAIAEVDWR